VIECQLLKGLLARNKPTKPTYRLDHYWSRLTVLKELSLHIAVKSLAILALAHFWCRLSLYFGGESSTEMTHQGVINLGRTTRARANQLNRHRGFDGSRSDNDTGKPKRRILLLPDLPPAVAKSSQPLQSQACRSSLAGSSSNYRNRGSALSLRQRPLRAKDLRGAITKGRGGTCQANPSARGYTATHWPGAGGRRRRSPGASHCPVSEPRHIAPTGPAERAGCPNISASHYRH
jgi:hypothetical protein